jgi:hypothetical protein
MELLTKLVREGHITLEEAFLLSEKEIVKEYIYIPNTTTSPWITNPYTNPNPIIYGTTTNTTCK